MLASGVLGFLFLLAVTAAVKDRGPGQVQHPIADVIKSLLGSFVCDLLLILVILTTVVRLTWAMSRDRQFRGWQPWQVMSGRTRRPG